MRRGVSTALAVVGLVVAAVATAEAGGQGMQPAAETPAYVQGEVIVRFRPELATRARAKILAVEGASVEKELRVGGAVLLELPAGRSVPDAVAAWSRRADVLAAQPNYVYRADAAPSDPLFGLLWGLNNTGQLVDTVRGAPDADIDAPEAWTLTTGSRAVRVAVVDTGVEYDHPDLAGNVVALGWDFYSGDADPRDENGHGTHVAGTIGANGNNGVGVTGVNWNVGLMPVRVLGPSGSGSTATIANGLAYAARNGARIVNASLGTTANDPLIANAIAGAPETLFVVSAGNGGPDGLGDNDDLVAQYPCDYDFANVICVAATDINDSLAVFSNYGTTSVDLAAPGVTIASTYTAGRYVYDDGTSMAAPHVTGAAALLLARNPGLAVAQLRAALLGSVDVLPWLATKVATSGRLNAYKALLAVGAQPPPYADTQPPVDPTLRSLTHGIGVPSRRRVVQIRWSGATDDQSGVDGFSYRLDNQPGSIPDTTKDAEEDGSGVDSSPLPNGRWYFHLRTRDNAGNWSSATHIGPFVVAVPRAVRAPVKKVLVCHRGRTIKVLKKQVAKHRRHGDKLGRCRPRKKSGK